MEEVINGILIREVETKNIMTKSSLPVGGYSVNPYVGCTHACKYSDQRQGIIMAMVSCLLCYISLFFHGRVWYTRLSSTNRNLKEIE